MPSSLYLEGFGALFLLETEIPLLPPVKKTENSKPRESNSTWEETKQEIYGGDQQYRMSAKYRGGEDQSDPYDAAKLEELKDSILKALTNSTNIRGLSDEHVVAVVRNQSRGESKDRFRVVTAPGASIGMGSVGFGRGGNSLSRVDVFHENSTKPHAASRVEKSEATMTIEVKKSDIEQFAKKNIEFEDFKKRAVITIY